MLNSPTVTQLPTRDPHVYAFEVRGNTQRDDLAAMAQLVNAAFDRGERIGLLIRLVDFDIADTAAGLSRPVIESGVRSLRAVERYAVVGPPAAAAFLIEAFDGLIPVQARTFASGDEADAWSFVASASR